VHSATDWLLRHRNDHPSPAAFFQEDYPFLHSNEGGQPTATWEQRVALESMDRKLTGKSPRESSWAINSEGHTRGNGLLKELTKAILERGLAAKMTEHLGYEKHDRAGHHHV
jgi:hypothetical protein